MLASEAPVLSPHIHHALMYFVTVATSGGTTGQQVPSRVDPDTSIIFVLQQHTRTSSSGSITSAQVFKESMSIPVTVYASWTERISKRASTETVFSLMPTQEQVYR